MSSVLIIEDEVNQSRILARVLEEEGFQALVEYRGDRGLETAVASAPDAVVLDLSLPGMDGLRVCRELRARGLRMPVIMLTARDAVSARVRAHLRRSGERAERLVVADLALEPGARRARG